MKLRLRSSIFDIYYSTLKIEMCALNLSAGQVGAHTSLSTFVSTSTLPSPHFRLQQQQIRLHLLSCPCAPLLYQKQKNMKIIVTGSLGHISKPLTKELVQRGHVVTGDSGEPERQNEIVALGATAAIGSMEDADFLTATFKGADIVYI